MNFDVENDFYHSCENNRIYKLLNQYELFKMTNDIEGDIIEFGVFKGCSLIRLATYRDYLGLRKKIVGFDVFGEYPDADNNQDSIARKHFIDDAGNESLSMFDIYKICGKKGFKDIDLVKGDICKTLPIYVKDNPNLKISFVNVDVDLYNPTRTILKYIYSRMSDGGIIMLDDYSTFYGETQAVTEFVKNDSQKIRRFDRGNHKPIFYIRK